MSDRTYAQLIVHAVPDDERDALAALLDDEDSELAGELGGVNEAPETFELAERYGWDEAPLDAADTLARLVLDAAPHAVFAAWVDPRYEYPGWLVMADPELGRWEGPCDEGGAAYITVHSVAELLGEEPPERFRELIAGAVGLSWRTRQRALVAAIEAVPTCDLCGEPDSANGAPDWNGETGRHLSCELVAAAR